jgi:peptidoglycan/xylan/chitin deacetylase (PgdA/CDA1 family)
MKETLYNLLNIIIPINLFLNRNNLKVLAYHDLKKSNKFESHLKFLINSDYNIIDINTLGDHLFLGDKLPNKPVLITFDDGDISVLELGLPLLKKYKLPSVMFIITSLIDSDNTFWCRQVEKALQEQGKSYAEARSKVNQLKKISNKNRMVYINSLNPVNSRQLTKKDLVNMQKGMMFIGNHTHTHPMVDMCTKEELENELNISKSCFEEWELPGFPIFAYPNGNWDEKSEKILKKNVIKIAFLFDHKINKKNINPMRISRIRVNSDNEINEFKVKVSGLHSFLMHKKNIIKQSFR